MVTGLLVTLIGITFWGIDFAFIPIPWSLLIMVIILWIYVKYFSGSWPQNNNAEFRKNNFRKIKLPGRVWKLGLTGAILFIVIFQSGFVVTFRLIQFPEQEFKSQYKILETLPRALAWLTVLVGSLVAGICEETGFRGYMQVPIEKRYGPYWGIFITSLFFFLLHLNKTWAPLITIHIFFASILLGLLAYYTRSLLPGMLGHTIIDVFNFSYWWSSLAGNFAWKTIRITGLDAHFIFWSLILMISIILFFFTIGKLKSLRNAII